MLPLSRAGSIALGTGAGLLAAMPLCVVPYYVELATYALICAMLALSLQLLVGCTGLVSLGHAAFYGLAAYTVYLITPADHGLSILITLPLAAAVAGAAALAVGALSLRTRGFYFLMVTLAFGQMVFFHLSRHQAWRRHRRRLSVATCAFRAGLGNAAQCSPAAATRLLRYPRPARRHLPGVRRPAALIVWARAWKVSASMSTACWHWASIPIATS